MGQSKPLRPGITIPASLVDTGIAYVKKAKPKAKAKRKGKAR
jgi:hypothetical protein